MYAGIANSEANGARKFIRNATRTRQTRKKSTTNMHPYMQARLQLTYIYLRAWTFSVNRIDRPIHANTHVVNAENATWKRLKTKLLDKVRKYTHYSYGARRNTNKKSFFFLHITCSFSEMRLARKKEYTLLCYCYSYITIYISGIFRTIFVLACTVCDIAMVYIIIHKWDQDTIQRIAI